ncbi:MAG: response regulator [Candidatus Cloacimonetes bacterium]|nr:response regulator [Candidatus Cloacimonadota bacterium]
MAKILIIDDEVDLLEILQAILESADHNVEICTSGRKAVSKIREEPFDLVLSDIVMPDQDGIETIKQITEIDPGMKIICMSGGGSLPAETYLKLAQHLGASKILRKPFQGAELIKSVNELLG